MAVAQGINKILAYAAQSGLGVAASSGGKKLRRRTANFTLNRDTYENDEIVSHQQSTGATAGIRRSVGKLSGLLSPLTYAELVAAALRKAFVATTSLTGLEITIAASGSAYTLTDTGTPFLTGGIKVGDVVRLTAGSFNAANLNKNLVVLAVTAEALTVTPLNGSTLVAQAGITGATVAVPGKKSWVPTASHTDVWFTFEEWYADLSKSELATDVKPGQIQIAVPATGNATIDIDFVGLNRTRGTSQVLTSPTAETSTPVLTAVNGKVVVGSSITPITGAQLTINPNVNPGEAEVGSNAISDVVRGRIMVSGQITAKFSSTTLQDLFDDQTATSLILTAASDSTAAADFVALVMSKVKIFGDAADDGEKEVIRTYPFTAEINGAGGAALANHQTILSIQDSAA